MKRSPVGLWEVCAWPNLARAFYLAGRGRRLTAPVQQFVTNLDTNLAELGEGLSEGWLPTGEFCTFTIRDPKVRRICAPSFIDRVAHHALMGPVEPVLERAMVVDSYACRKGKGNGAAVVRAQQLSQRWPVYLKMDVRSYFASIRHARVMALLERRFGNRHLLGLFERVLGHLPGGIGLPIGTLTSQHLANYYLDGLDRYLLAHPEVGGMVRYMDDIIVWCRTTQAAIRIRERARAWLWWERGLTLRPDAQIGRTAAGVPFLGFLVCRGRLGLLRRRRRRLVWAVRRWTRRFRRGEIGEAGYQRGLDAALAVGAGADMDRWRAAAMKNWVGEEA